MWKQTLDVEDVFHNDDLDIIQKRDLIVARARALRPEGEDLDLDGILDELADVDSIRYFDIVWHGFYDWADAERVWVKT